MSITAKKGAYKYTRAFYAVFAFCSFFTYVKFAYTLKRNQLFAFDFFFTRNSFAGLVANSTARFASGLTGASAFATTGNFLICGFRNRLNHNILPIHLDFMVLL